MPTVLRHGPYRLYFFSHEPGEPSHIHIDRDNQTCKIWLHDLSVARSIGFRGPELNKIVSIVREHREELKEAWDGYFGIGVG